jgi:D-aminopeptidase
MDHERKRARELGFVLGPFPTGQHNAITDVAGVRVGHSTVVEGEAIRTGVTAVVPDAVEVAGGSLPAGLFAGNGYGKLTGATQVAELGQIETPVILTGTLSVFRAADALVTYMLALSGNDKKVPLAPPGTSALGFKAGIGPASRSLRVPGDQPCTLGVLVQSNFSGRLTVRGVPIAARAGAGSDANSCMIVIAIDVGLDSRQLTRVARRAVFAMGRTGADFAGPSGDYAIAFATVTASPVAEAALSAPAGRLACWAASR